MLDSNMYGEGGWFYSGFDRIHDDQVEWCMNRLNDLKKCNPDIKAMAFFHMPPAEFKEPELDPEPSVSTNSTTSAQQKCIYAISAHLASIFCLPFPFCGN